MDNPQYINSLLNTSVSKHTFSFSKSRRFKTQHPKDNYRFYNLPSMRSQRAAGLGIGQKQQITIKSISPPPGAYQSKSMFDKNNNNGTTFKYGREQVLFNNPMSSLKKSRKQIGPNHYHIKTKYFSKKGGVIGQKLKTDFDELKKRNVPGPGTYNFKGADMNKSGQYFLSSYRNNSPPRYHQTTSSKSERDICMTASASKIGPGHYKMNRDIGKSLLSKFRNNTCCSFSKSKRQSLQDKSKKNFPSFHYKRFSQFGTLN